VDLKREVVDFCNACKKVRYDGLSFVFVLFRVQPRASGHVIALHACDIATDQQFSKLKWQTELFVAPAVSMSLQSNEDITLHSLRACFARAFARFLRSCVGTAFNDGYKIDV